MAQQYAAEKRISTALLTAFEGNPDGYAAAIVLFDNDLAERATEAECRRRDTGITLVLEQLAELQIQPAKGPSGKVHDVGAEPRHRSM